MLRQWLQTSHLAMGGQDERREMPFKIGLSGDQKCQGQRRTTWTRRRIFSHAAVGMVEDACVNNHDRTRRWKPLTVQSRWPRAMCREHTSMVKLAGGFTLIYLKDMSKLASWPDVAGASMERVTQRQFGETQVTCVERVP